MHELPITQNILEITTRHARQAGAKRITAIHLVIGDLTGYLADSIQFYFDFLSRGTLAEGGQISIRRVPARARCRACGHEFEPEDLRLWQCPACGHLGSEVLAGREFLVESIEVE